MLNSSVTTKTCTAGEGARSDAAQSLAYLSASERRFLPGYLDRYEVLVTRREDEFQFMFQVSVKMIDFAHSTFEGFLNDPPLHEGPGRV